MTLNDPFQSRGVAATHPLPQMSSCVTQYHKDQGSFLGCEMESEAHWVCWCLWAVAKKHPWLNQCCLL